MHNNYVQDYPVSNDPNLYGQKNFTRKPAPQVDSTFNYQPVTTNVSSQCFHCWLWFSNTEDLLKHQRFCENIEREPKISARYLSNQIQQQNHLIQQQPSQLLRNSSTLPQYRPASVNVLQQNPVRTSIPPSLAPKDKPRKGILYFGVKINNRVSYSLVGGCGWQLRDEYNRVITEGFCFVELPYFSKNRLEHECLLLGLNAAIVKDITLVTIACNSPSVLHNVSAKPGAATNSSFSMCSVSLRSEVKDLLPLVMHSLSVFQGFQTFLITPDQNNYCNEILAEKALQAYQKKRSKEINRLIFTDYGLKKYQESNFQEFKDKY